MHFLEYIDICLVQFFTPCFITLVLHVSIRIKEPSRPGIILKDDNRLVGFFFFHFIQGNGKQCNTPVVMVLIHALLTLFTLFYLFRPASRVGQAKEAGKENSPPHEVISEDSITSNGHATEEEIVRI